MNKENPEELPLFEDSNGNENENNNNLGYEEDEFDEFYGDEDPDGEDDDPIDPEDFCHMSGIFFELMKMPKPLGFIMPQEKMEDFLKARGYKIISRFSDNRNEEYNVAIKPGSSYIPENDYSNVREVFDGEVQDILLKWLLKVGKED